MYDATELCDRVAFIVDGSLRALDTPSRADYGKGRFHDPVHLFPGREGKTAEVELTAPGRMSSLQRLLKENRLLSIHSSEPTLNDVFVEITGGAAIENMVFAAGRFRFQYKYGFYLLYLVFSILYISLIFSLPQAWRGKGGHTDVSLRIRRRWALLYGSDRAF
jgi:hypothetical protein